MDNCQISLPCYKDILTDISAHVSGSRRISYNAKLGAESMAL